MSDPYEEFLAAKRVDPQALGPATFGDTHSALRPFQAAQVRWAVRRGRAALFDDTGLGKTRMELDWLRLIVREQGLVLAPLAVAHQTIAEAASLGIGLTYVRNPAEQRKSGVHITNYERFADLDLSLYDAVVLDESQILKSFTGKLRLALTAAFKDTRYRLCATATPAPNDHLELGNHAEFLGILRSQEMLARWFIPDTERAGNYRLKGHAAASFWQWVATWAIACRRPSDIHPDFDDTPYLLPPMHWVRHDLGDSRLRKVSATRLWEKKRETLEERCERVATIVTASKRRPWVLWCDTNDESTRLAELVPGALELRGDQSLDEKEERLRSFSDGSIRILVTKPGIAGLGLNWQHCADFACAGLTYSFEQMYQLSRRFHRYGQRRAVTGHIVVTSAEESVAAALDRKAAEHERMMDEMVQATRAAKQAAVSVSTGQACELDRPAETATGPGWKLHLGDAVEVVRGLPDNQVDFSIFSPPFANLYTYSDSTKDMGNSRNYEEFIEHYGYLLPHLLRVTRPGRLCAVHCKDLPLYAHRDGAPGLFDFPGALVRAHEAAGWTFHSRVTIWKDPKTELQRTWAHGLKHDSFKKRGEVCRQALADYLLVFRRHEDEVTDKQIVRKVLPGAYRGEQPPTKWQNAEDYSIQLWQRYASPVWFDIAASRVLPFRGGKEERDERHIAPLQLGVIERAIWLWSNPGDLIFSPFAGVGSELYQALQMGRRGEGVELKRSYWEQAQRNLAAAETPLFVERAT